MKKELDTRWAKKCTGITQMQRNMNKLLKQVSDDLVNKDEKTALTALVVRIIMRTSERVGNDESAKNGHYGITGLLKWHVEFDEKGKWMNLNYVGKSGVLQHKEVDIGSLGNFLLLPLLKRRKKNEFLFATTEGVRIDRKKVNAYLAQFNITAKDIRCYNCNELMLKSLRFSPTGKTPTERKRIFNDTLKKVAAYIGHGAPTLRNHYLIPSIENQYINEGTIKTNLKC